MNCICGHDVKLHSTHGCMATVNPSSDFDLCDCSLQQDSAILQSYKAAAAERDRLQAVVDSFRDLLIANNAVNARDLGGVINVLQRKVAQQAAQLEQARIKIEDAANVISLQAECIRQGAIEPEHAFLLTEIAKSYRAWLAANAPAPEAKHYFDSAQKYREALE